MTRTAPPVDAAAALNELDALARGRTTVNIADLPARLAIVAAPDGRVGPGPFRHTGQWTMLAVDAPVVMRQSRLKTARVRAYLIALADGRPVEPVAVTEHPDGRVWHLDGAHRLVAQRLLGLPVDADIWV